MFELDEMFYDDINYRNTMLQELLSSEIFNNLLEYCNKEIKKLENLLYDPNLNDEIIYSMKKLFVYKRLFILDVLEKFKVNLWSNNDVINYILRDIEIEEWNIKMNNPEFNKILYNESDLIIIKIEYLSKFNNIWKYISSNLDNIVSTNITNNYFEEDKSYLWNWLL